MELHKECANSRSGGMIFTGFGSRQPIVDDYVAVGSHSFDVKSAAGYKPGDRIVVYRLIRGLRQRPATLQGVHAA